MVLFTDMVQHLQMLFITKRLKVSMICGSQNMNSIMRYDISSESMDKSERIMTFVSIISKSVMLVLVLLIGKIMARQNSGTSPDT